VESNGGRDVKPSGADGRNKLHKIIKQKKDITATRIRRVPSKIRI
jgi:hypothetical protein